MNSLGAVVEDTQEKDTCTTSQPRILQAAGSITVRTLMDRSLAVGPHKWLKAQGQRWIFMIPRVTFVLPQPCLCRCNQVTTDIDMEGKSWSEKSCNLSYHLP